jgi:hypothetical protein
MEGSVMDGVKDALLGLRAKSKTGRLRELLPIIEAKVEEGVRHEDIHAVLNQLGLSMSLEVYKTTLYRVRKERAETCKAIVSQALPGSTRGGRSHIAYRARAYSITKAVDDTHRPRCTRVVRLGIRTRQKNRVVIIHLPRRRTL